MTKMKDLFPPKGHKGSYIKNVVHPVFDSERNAFINSGYQKDAAVAKSLTQYFKRIKKYINSNNDDKIFKDDFVELIKKNLGNNLSGLFDYAGLGSQAKGDKFEKDIEKIFQSVEKINNPSIESVSKFQSGTDLSFTSLVYNTAEATWKQMFKDKDRKIGDNFEKIGEGLYKLKGAQQKVDIKGFSAEIQVNSELLPEMQEFINLTKGRTFSLKNYKSDTITLGSTSWERVLGSVFPKLGIDEERIKYLTGYFTYASLKNNNIIEPHGDHIKIFYELTGYGQLDKELQDLKTADFLMINDNKSINNDNIIVLSSKDILQQILKYDKKNNNGISIKANWVNSGRRHNRQIDLVINYKYYENN